MWDMDYKYANFNTIKTSENTVDYIKKVLS
jgi:hypothetical protein